MTKARLARVGWISCVTAVAVMLLRADTPYTIAYTTFAPLNTAVFIADADGTERMLVPDAMFDSNPSFSADGRWVLFSSRRHGSVDIYRVQVNGTHLERLTEDFAFDDQPGARRKARRVRVDTERPADIWLLDLQSKRLRNLTNHRGGDYRPAWSPDGKWIAFTSDRDSDGALAHTTTFPSFAPLQYTQIYVMGADGSGVRRVTQGDTTVGGASWSPDGKAIAFYEAVPLQWMHHGRPFVGPVVVSQIGRVDVATGARTPLTTGAGRKLTPQWLPDGRIAYLRSDTEENPGQGYRRPDFWSEKICFADGSNGAAGIFTGIRWSADGKHIVFHRAIEKKPPAVRKVFSPDPLFRLVRTGGLLG